VHPKHPRKDLSYDPFTPAGAAEGAAAPAGADGVSLEGLAAGSKVKYWSQTVSRWVSATVKARHRRNGYLAQRVLHPAFFLQTVSECVQIIQLLRVCFAGGL